MAKKPRKIDLGVYAAGEIPAPLIHVYKDNQKVVIPITGWTLKGFRITGPVSYTHLTLPTTPYV